MMWTTLQRSKLTDEINGWQGGLGPQLLMIHGVGMHADYWSNLIPALVEHFSLTVVDMPGHGASQDFADFWPGLSNYTDCIAKLIQRSGDAPTLVVGHSMGAMITIDLAVRYSGLIEAFVALNAVYQRSKKANAAVQARAASLIDHAPIDSSDTLNRWFGQEPVGVDVLALNACSQWLREINLVGYRQAYHAFAYHDGPDENDLKKIRCPALFMTGELEPNSTPHMSQSLAAATEQGACHIVNGARHMMPMTHGNDVLNRLIPFLRQHAVNL